MQVFATVAFKVAMPGDAAAELATLRDFRRLLSHADVLVQRFGSLVAVAGRLDQLECQNALAKSENEVQALQLDELRRENQQLKAESEAIERRWASAAACVDELGRQSRQAAADREMLKLQLQDRSGALKAADQRLGDLERQEHQLKSRIGALQEQIQERCRAEVVLQQRLKRAEGENAALRHRQPQQELQTALASCGFGGNENHLVRSNSENTRMIVAVHGVNRTSSGTYVLSASTRPADTTRDVTPDERRAVDVDLCEDPSVLEMNLSESEFARNLTSTTTESPTTTTTPTPLTAPEGFFDRGDTNNTISPANDRPNKRPRICSQIEKSARGVVEMPILAVDVESEDHLDASCVGERSFDEYDDDEEWSLSSSPIRSGHHDLVTAARTKSIDKIITYKWNLPYTAYFSSVHPRRVQPPRLDLEMFIQLDAARPWDLIFDRRPKASRIFDYQTLGPRAKKWVRKMQWFQFTFRREHWEYMHWIPMEERQADAKWEAYRQDRDLRIKNAKTAWTAVYEQAAGLVKRNKIPREVWLDASIWFMDDKPLKWQYMTRNLVQEQAKQDLQNPVRCNYVRRFHEHPICSGEYRSKYSMEYDLPPLLSPDQKQAVRACRVKDSDTSGAIRCPTSWRTLEFAPTFELVPAPSVASI